MKKLILILICFMPLFAMAQFDTGDTLYTNGKSVYLYHLTELSRNDSGFVPVNKGTYIDWEDIVSRINNLDSLGIFSTDVQAGEQDINSGTTEITFPGAFDSTDLDIAVVPYVRRISDNAVIDYTISEITTTSFKVTVWENNCNIKYVASQKNPASNEFFNNILLKTDTLEYVQVETDPKYATDSSFIKTGVRDWNSSLAKTISTEDTTWWGRVETDPVYSADTIGLTTNYLVKKKADGFTNSSIFDNGNVGIGTTTPDGGKLEINQSADDNGIRINGYDDQSTKWVKLNVSSGGYGQFDAKNGFRFMFDGSYMAYIDNTAINGFRIYDNVAFSFGTTETTRYSMGYDNVSGNFNLSYAGSFRVASKVKFTITNLGNVGIGTTTPLHKTSIVGSAATNLNLFNAVNSDINKNRTTVAQACDTASVCVQSTSTGSITFKIVGKTGLQFQSDSVNTIISGALISPKIKLTVEGGYAIKLTNKTGANSVKGTIVISDPDVDNAFEVNPTSGSMPFGIVYESGIADGSECWVVVSGIAEALIVDGATTTRGYVCLSSTTVAGRIDTQSTVPSATEHFTEIGHTIESKSSGTNVLAKCVIHFN